jgi:hypothetical protein
VSDADQEKQLTLRGIVVPAQWDGNGLVRSVAILTRDEGEYEVAPGGAGGQLTAHLRREVLAQAVLMNGPGDVKRVLVDSFAILEWNESDDETITTLNVEGGQL